MWQCPPQKRSVWSFESSLSWTVSWSFQCTLLQKLHKQFTRHTIHTLHSYISSMCSIYKCSNFPPRCFLKQATEKLQATLRELEAAKVQLEAGRASASNPVGGLVGWKWFLELCHFPTIKISHHGHRISWSLIFLGYESWTLVFFSISDASFFSCASSWLACIVICKYRSLQEQHT